jgi:hypothetical protein
MKVLRVAFTGAITPQNRTYLFVKLSHLQFGQKFGIIFTWKTETSPASVCETKLDSPQQTG